MKRRLLLPALLGTGFALAGCASLLGPQTVHFDLAELDQRLARRFPLERRLLEVLEVTLSRPQLRLLPDRQRLAVELALAGRDRLFGSRFQGRLALETALRYEAADQSLRLAEVTVTALSLGEVGLPPRLDGQRLGPALAALLLEDSVLFRLTPEQLARARRLGLQPQAVQVVAQGIDITLVPI